MISLLLASILFQSPVSSPAVIQENSRQWWESLSKQDQVVLQGRMNRWRALSIQGKKEMKTQMQLLERTEKRGRKHQARIHRALRHAVQEQEISSAVAVILFEGPMEDALFVLGHLHKERFLAQASAQDLWLRHEISPQHETLLREMRPQEFFQSLAHLGVLGHSFSRRGPRF